MTSYFTGLSLREIYEKKCAEFHCRKNSELCRALPDVPDEFHDLTFIDLSKNFLGPKGILPLLEIIRRCRNIRTLDFSQQQLDNEAIDAICLAIKKHPSVVHINLSDNPLTMSAGASLLRLVRENPVLEYITLQGCGVGPSIVTAIDFHLNKNKMQKKKEAEEKVISLLTEEKKHLFTLQGNNNSNNKTAKKKSSFLNVCAAKTAALRTLEEEEKKEENEDDDDVNDDSLANITATALPACADGTERRRLKRHDVEAALLLISHNVHEILFDEDPVPAMAYLCEQQNGWFYDTQFAADDVSVQHCATVNHDIASWRRVGDIYPSAKLFPSEEEEEGKILNLPRNSPLDFSWIFSCVDAVFNDMESLRRCLTYSSCTEHGVYSLRVHIDGAWRYVIVDDLLPVNSKDELIFTHPVQEKYFWPCILEKALAKLHGGYHAISLYFIEGLRLKAASTKIEKNNKLLTNARGCSVISNDVGGNIANNNVSERKTNCAKTLADLSGGVGIVRFLSYEYFQSDEWWLTMLDLYNSGAMLMALSSETAAKTMQGIESCHIYRILQVQHVNGVKLIELFSMWTNIHWKGDWSDDSPLWMRQRDVDAAVRGNRSIKKPFSFWMSYTDFITAFIQVHVCQTFQGYYERIIDDVWDRNSAGGSCYEHNWHLNPHYKLKVTQDSRFFINLTLPDKRFTTTDIESLAFHVFCSEKYPLQYEGDDSEQVVVATKYVITDSVCFEGVIKAGEDYWIVPSSHACGVMGKFFLRMFSQSGFVIWKGDLSYYWNSLTHTDTVKCSGEYRVCDDNVQFALCFDRNKNDNGDKKVENGSLVVKARVVEQDELALCMFLVKSTILRDRPTRSIGMLSNENIIAESTFTRDDSVCLKADVLPGERYTLVLCVYPVGSSAKLLFNMWTSLPTPLLTPLPVWQKKTVVVSWPLGSGSYYEATRNPQIEIYPARVCDTFVIKMQVTQCSYDDFAIVFFVLANDGRQGEGIKGQIPEDRVLVRSQYVRHYVVQCEFFAKEPLDSLLILPCLQPAGSFGECTISVATESGDFMLRALSMN